MKKTLSKKTVSKPLSEEYGGLIGGIAELLEAARRTAARSVNALMTATYSEIGRRIVEFEQQGEARAGYGEQILYQLSARFDGAIRTWIWPEESFSDSGILSRLSVNCADIVCTISERADTVCTIRRRVLERHGFSNQAARHFQSPSRQSPLMASHLGSAPPSLCHGRIMSGCSP